MPRKKKTAKDMTTEELAKKVFPKKVRDKLKEIAHGKEEKQVQIHLHKRNDNTDSCPCQVYNPLKMLRGKVHKYGADVDTDAIIPARYLNVSDPAELARHCMEDIDADFVKRVSKGDVIVATTNFGCGSSREHAPLAIKASGISCVIAKSFARIFFRNAINIGLPLLESEDAPDNLQMNDVVEVDLVKGIITKVGTGQVFTAKPYPEFMEELISAGGLIEHTRKRLATGGR